MLLVGGGISAAAENSLPGDPLFPVKVSVNEQIRSALAISNESQAKLDSKLAQRRLEEAEELASEGKLEGEAQGQIEASFEARAESAKKHLAKMEEKGQANAAVEISSDLESSLQAHETILASINVRQEDTVAIEPLITKIRNRTVAFGEVKIRGEQGVATESSQMQLKTMPPPYDNRDREEDRVEGSTEAAVEVNFEEQAKKRQETSEKKIKEFREFIKENRDELRAEAVVRAEASLGKADKLMIEGKAKMEAGFFSEAFELFQDAHKTIEEARLIIRIEKNLKLNLDLLHEKLRTHIETKGGVKVEHSPYITPASSVIPPRGEIEIQPYPRFENKIQVEVHAE
ncbi:MAG: DUF5667 domain-containing protein [bacterium]|nr:DUF5667 domain-containing protein [bacterium]